MKIFNVANFSLNRLAKMYYSTDRKMTNGLIRNGHFVYDFSYGDTARSANMFGTKRFGVGRMNQALIKTAAMLRPDLVLLGHTEIVKPETLVEIRRLLPDVKIVQWWVDPFTEPRRIATIAHKLPHLDAFFATTNPQAFNGDDILGMPPSGCRYAYMPQFCDSSIETGRAFDNTDSACDLVFIGRTVKSARDDFVARMMREITNLRITLKGQSRDDLVFGDDFMRCLAGAKAGLSYNRMNDVSLYTSNRLVQLTGNGLLAFSPRIPDLNHLFTEDEIVYFDDFDDFKRKLDDYMSNDEKRIAHAKRGWEKVHRAFNSTRITKFILEVIFNKPLSENYEWSDYILNPADASS